jgi:hypothetical protein
MEQVDLVLECENQVGVLCPPKHPPRWREERVYEGLTARFSGSLYDPFNDSAVSEMQAIEGPNRHDDRAKRGVERFVSVDDLHQWLIP